MENLEKRIEEIKREAVEMVSKKLDELKNELRAPEKTGFEIGKWYKSDLASGCLIIFKESERGCNPGFWRGNWATNWHMGSGEGNWTPATESEIKEALVKEAEKRGFKEGVNYKPICHFEGGNSMATCTGNFTYHGSDYDALSCGYQYIYNKGEWAEILKDEPITIGGHTVILLQNKIKVGCKEFSREFIHYLADTMRLNNFSWIQFDKDNAVSVDTVNKILDKLK